MAPARRHLRKQWRPVHAESPPERQLLHAHKRGCQQLVPEVTWGDAKLRRRAPYGPGKEGERAPAWQAVRPTVVSYDETMSAPPVALPSARRVRFAQAVRFRTRRVGSEASSEADSELDKVHAALGIPDGTGAPAPGRARTFRPVRNVCPPLRSLRSLLGRHRFTPEDADLALAWSAFEYHPTPYTSVWAPPPPRQSSALRRLWSRLAPCARPRPSAPPPPTFTHTDPSALADAPFPPLAPFGALQYTAGTVGCESLPTDGVEAWQRMSKGTGKPPSMAMLYAARSWLYPE